MAQEVYISVDIETAGPIPGEFSMLSLGACVVGDEALRFYAELQPINSNAIPKALEISGFTLEQLSEKGEAPKIAMNKFRDWLKEVRGTRKPVFVGFNAAFDWSFINWYFVKFLGDNPFGFAALDIKAYYMGLSGCRWSETTSSQLPAEFQPSKSGTHNALDDAVAQAEMFKKMIAAKGRS